MSTAVRRRWTSIGRGHSGVIERILRHCGLWIDPRDRSSSETPATLFDNQLDLKLECLNYEPSHRLQETSRW